MLRVGPYLSRVPFNKPVTSTYVMNAIIGTYRSGALSSPHGGTYAKPGWWEGGGLSCQYEDTQMLRTYSFRTRTLNVRGSFDALPAPYTHTRQDTQTQSSKLLSLRVCVCVCASAIHETNSPLTICLDAAPLLVSVWHQQRLELVQDKAIVDVKVVAQRLPKRRQA